jgi:hypothetical protein
MKNEKTKTIIKLIQIIDKSLDDILSSKESNKVEKSPIYKWNVAETLFRELFRPYLGDSFNKLRRKPQLIQYDWLKVLKSLTPFQETLFTVLEKEALAKYGYKKSLVDNRVEFIPDYK